MQFSPRQRSLRALLRKTLTTPLTDMETILVGVVAPILFIYLFATMIRPEKF